MVELVTTDEKQITMLEWLLINNDIDYVLRVDTPYSSFQLPYLIVNGVPLDFERSIKWIGERCNVEEN